MGNTLDKQRARGFPVFLYHALAPQAPNGLGWRDRKYWMPATLFREHLRAIRTAGAAVVSLEQAWRAAGDAPAAVLTFDDGRSSDYQAAWPMLAEAGFTASFFLNTAAVGEPGYLDWNQVREMADGGASIQSHGHHHTDLTVLSAETRRAALRHSKELLERRTGRPVDFLAAPYGRVNRSVIEDAFEAGYRAVCTSEPRPAKPGTATIGRIAMYAHTGAAEAARLAAGNRTSYRVRGARAAWVALAKLFLSTPGERQKPPNGDGR